MDCRFFSSSIYLHSVGWLAASRSIAPLSIPNPTPFSPSLWLFIRNFVFFFLSFSSVSVAATIHCSFIDKCFREHINMKMQRNNLYATCMHKKVFFPHRLWARFWQNEFYIACCFQVASMKPTCLSNVFSSVCSIHFPRSLSATYLCIFFPTSPSFDLNCTINSSTHTIHIFLFNFRSLQCASYVMLRAERAKASFILNYLHISFADFLSLSLSHSSIKHPFK